MKELLKKFEVDQAKSMATPMSWTIQLDVDEKGKGFDIRKYQAMIGSLLYLITSRLDSTV